jgi:exodeoxyribonuclease-3
MKIITWNVNGIRARGGQVLDLVERERPDVLCLQELKARTDQIPEPLAALPGYWCYWHGAAAYSGVSLHLRTERAERCPEFVHAEFDHETRIVEAALGDVVVVSVYVPNGGKDYAAKLAFLEAMARHVTALHASGRSVVICGDLNVARTEKDVHPKERKPLAIGQRPDERALLEQVIAAGVVDVGRALDPDNENMFSWWAPWRNMRQRNIGWRLDYILASAPLAQRALACPVLSDVGTSDHAPVMLTLADS